MSTPTDGLDRAARTARYALGRALDELEHARDFLDQARDELPGEGA